MNAIPAYLQNILPNGKLPPSLPGLAHPWLATLREKALTRFLQHGLPQPKQEEWRYTNLFALEKTNFAASTDEAAIRHIPAFAPSASARLVFVDGHFRPELSEMPKAKGLSITTLRQKLRENDTSVRYAFPDEAQADSWHALNLALFEDGAVIEVEAGAVIEEPVEIITLASPQNEARMHHLRPLLQVGEGARLTTAEYIGGNSPFFLSMVMQVLVEKNAHLTRLTANASGAEASLLLHENIRVARDARYTHTLLHAGGKLTRHKMVVQLEDSGAEAQLHAAHIVSGKRHVDVVTDMRHMAPHTQSTQNIRALAEGDGKAIYQGGIFVDAKAQKTNAQQNHHGLLLSGAAEINAKPALEIYADDVKCGHGATCGALDANHLFYLRSRGIPQKEAEEMLIGAFLAEVLDTAPETLRENITHMAMEARDGM